jgi:predicted ATPase/DNA-binding SARP family transcriptional activator
LLGPPIVECDGEPIDVDTRKAIALLAYLAVTAGLHARDTLATLLWPEYDQTRARANLRRTLSVLNTSGAGPWLEADRETIALRQDDSIWLDTEQFQRRLTDCRTHGHPPADVCPACLPLLTEAAELYRDHFLAGFTLRDSPEFDEWQLFQTEHLRRELAGTLDRLVQGHSAQGQFETAIGHAQRRLTLDPLHEPAHCHLMQLYTWTGDRAAALRQYHECVRILEAELGVSPLEETTQLYELIKEQRRGEVEEQRSRKEPVSTVPDVHPSAPLPLSPPAPLLPLVGRSAEWITLLQTYHAIGPDGHFVILEGEAGIGKTRLAEEFLAYVRAHGGLTIAARCYEGETHLAYGPFIEGLRAAIYGLDYSDRLADVAVHWLSEVARLLPELHDLRPGLPAPPSLDSPGAQSRFFEGVSQVLLALSGGSPPGVLFFDDLHWADATSLSLLAYLVRRLQGRPLCILVTWRDEQLPAGHCLHHLLAEAQRAGMATHLSLSRLGRPEVMALVEASATPGFAPPNALGAQLYRETEGLPFFLVEYLAMMARETGLGEADWPLPGGIRDLLHSRLAGVSETGAQLLQTAAVIGRSFDFDTLRTASGRGEEEAVTALEDLIARGLVQETSSVEIGDGRREIPNTQSPLSHLQYDFNHGKLRTLVYDETSLARRRLLHRRVAKTLASHARGRRQVGSLAGQIARHYQLAGRAPEAADYFRRAGDHARTLYANREALNHFQSALALGHPEAAPLHEAVGDVQTLLGEYHAALTAYEMAAALCGTHGLARIEHKLGQVCQRQGEWEPAESHFRAALEMLDQAEDARQSAQLYADRSLTAHHLGQDDRALDLAHRALELAEAAGDSPALAQAHNILGVLVRGQNNPEAARRHLERSLELADALGDPTARVAALNNLALVCGDSADLERAFALVEKALVLCQSQGDRHREAALHNHLADLCHAAGQSEAAMAHLKQAVALFAEIGQAAGDWQPEIWKLMEW